MNKGYVDDLIRRMAANKGNGDIDVREELSLRLDLGFDSFDLAELTVRIDDRFGIDIFEKNLRIDTIKDVYEALGLEEGT